MSGVGSVVASDNSIELSNLEEAVSRMDQRLKDIQKQGDQHIRRAEANSKNHDQIERQAEVLRKMNKVFLRSI